jgi:hypothetical protein
LLLVAVLPAPEVLAEMSLSERSLPADTVIKETFQAGTGLPVGKIQSVRGECNIFHRDPSVGYRARAGLPLYLGDTLQTRKDSRILFRLVDGSIIAMAPGSRLTLLQINTNSARKSSLSFLVLKKGAARFYINPRPDFSMFEFKVQTETAFIQAQTADFVIKVDAGKTGIATFENSRLEVTSLAEPEESHFLSDHQRTVIIAETASPVVETVSAGDAEELTAEFRLAPANGFSASGSTDFRTVDITEENLED